MYASGLLSSPQSSLHFSSGVYEVLLDPLEHKALYSVIGSFFSEVHWCLVPMMLKVGPYVSR